MFRRRQRPSAVDRPAETSGAALEPVRGDDAPVSVLQAGSLVTGRLAALGRLRVHGTIRGDVEVAGLLEVGADGVIEASSVRAEGLVVLGRVVADVDVAGTVELWKGAVLHGDVRATAIDIESGASFVGRSSMRAGDAPALPALADAAPADATPADAAPAGSEDAAPRDANDAGAEADAAAGAADGPSREHG